MANEAKVQRLTERLEKIQARLVEVQALEDSQMKTIRIGNIQERIVNVTAKISAAQQEEA